MTSTEVEMPPVNSFLMERLKARIHRQDFNATLNILQDFENVKTEVLRLVHDYKKSSVDEEIQRAIEAAKEYHSGKIDPSRPFGKFERMEHNHNVKKILQLKNNKRFK